MVREGGRRGGPHGGMRLSQEQGTAPLLGAPLSAPPDVTCARQRAAPAGAARMAGGERWGGGGGDEGGLPVTSSAAL